MADKQENKEEFPTVEEQMGNLAKFAIEMVTDMAVKNDLDVFVNEDTKNGRLSICNKCEHYARRQKRCRLCGCWMEHKAKFTVSRCPDDRW